MDSVQYGTATESLSYVRHKMKEHVSVAVDFDVDGIFSIKNEDLEKLMLALLDKRVFYLKLCGKLHLGETKRVIVFFLAMPEDMRQQALSFWDIVLLTILILTSRLHIPVFQMNSSCLSMLTMIGTIIGKTSVNVVTAILTFPENTKMVKLTKRNFWNALSISVKPEQNKFVLNAKSSVAMGLFYKTQKVYVQNGR